MSLRTLGGSLRDESEVEWEWWEWEFLHQLSALGFCGKPLLRTD